MPRWTVIVDLRKCIGCGCCVANCSQVNQLPVDGAWRQVPDFLLKSESGIRRISLPINCMHCTHPPCLEVCPAGATYQRSDGIVDIRPDQCIGCGYCIFACPYMARKIVGKASHWVVESDYADGESPVKKFERGICTKCNLCLPILEEGLRRGLRPGVDADATPECVITCLSQALQFGDRDDPASPVYKIFQENHLMRIHEDLGTEPSMYYIVDGLFDGLGSRAEEEMPRPRSASELPGLGPG